MSKDAYSLSEINFVDAQWMRKHRFHPASVEAARASRYLTSRREAIDIAYAEAEQAAKELANAMKEVTKQREQNGD